MPAPLFTLPFVKAASHTAVASALGQYLSSLPSTAFGIGDMRGARIQFASNGADGETATYTLYAIDAYGSHSGGPGFFAISLGTLAITLSTALGSDFTTGPTSLVPSTHRFADTVVWSVSTYGTARLTYCGGNAAAFSPADNTVAEFLISDFGGSRWIALLPTTYGLTSTSTVFPLISAIV